jgi:hypothetical protein
MSSHQLGHTVKSGIEIVKELPPLAAKKNVAIAAVAGFFFGALGVAIYFKSARDFFVCLAIFIALTAMMPIGPGELLGWLFAPIYGAWRAHTSNENGGW